MRRLTVLYDTRCTLCREARWWLERQPRFIELDFVAAGSDELRRRYPGIDPDETRRQLTVVGDDRAVYRGAKAWVMCLWALTEYREWSHRLAAPHLLPLAERTFRWLSRRRRKMGALVRFLRRTGVRGMAERRTTPA